MSILTLPFDIEALKRVKESLSYAKFLPILFKGYLAVQTKGIDNAIDIYIEAVDKAPGFVPLYCLFVVIYSSLGRFEDAITEYKMAIWLDSLNIPAYRHLCRAYEDLGDYDNDSEREEHGEDFEDISYLLKNLCIVIILLSKEKGKTIEEILEIIQKYNFSLFNFIKENEDEYNSYLSLSITDQGYELYENFKKGKETF